MAGFTASGQVSRSSDGICRYMVEEKASKAEACDVSLKD